MLQLQNSLVESLRTKPFSRITYKEITEGVDIDRSTVYRYYNHKNQVLQAAVDVRLTAFASRVDLTFGRKESIDGYMGRLVDAWIGLWLESGPLLAAASGLGAEPGPPREWWRERIGPWIEAVREAIEVGRFVEELPEDGRPAGPLAEMTVGLCLSTFNRELTVERDEEHRTMVRDLLLDAILRIMGRR
ncbi:TetR/AcrR family transcriptional regulator [Nocardiopsis sp. MG754419]|uniref:TetR/AcrR family transcriptional regulator n=1 Tax=Nocardiopsis sp. MG754419 TaxID=2259865 RepID=UPI001BA5ECBD|nr:TetR/AcrR family transcriptional regulator [Nocardiopsis sp. MG754419]MBR8740835.1 TetR/AcrR family transcriptional regulator [Nocardiopsis sp. MG754419]